MYLAFKKLSCLSPRTKNNTQETDTALKAIPYALVKSYFPILFQHRREALPSRGNLFFSGNGVLQQNKAYALFSKSLFIFS